MENEEQIIAALEQLLQVAGEEWTLAALQALIEEAGQGGAEPEVMSEGGMGAMPPAGPKRNALAM